MIMEYALGNKYRAAGPFSYRSLSRRWEWLGWWQVAVSFVIGTYYMIIIGWVLSYTYFSFGNQWGSDTESFFTGQFLGVSDSFWNIGFIQWRLFIALAAAWAIVYWLLRRGVSRGIELASRVLIPTLVVMIFIIVIRGLTLPGAAEGLNLLLTPDFGALLNPLVWAAAYGQVFFSLSLGFTVMITYASYLPRRTDLSNSGFIAALANSGFEFFAAIGIFSVLGFLAVQQNTDVEGVVQAGIGLAFIAIPQIINELPALNSLFGVLFFGALLFAGLTSAVSIFEVGIAAVREKFDLARTAAVNRVCGLAALIGILYTTRGGLYYLDTVDHFINSYGLLLSGFFEVILVAWVVRRLGTLQEHINESSYIRVGRWWILALSVITPLLLAVVIVINIINEFATAYEDYPVSGLVVLGGGATIGAIVVGVVFQRIKTREKNERRTA